MRRLVLMTTVFVLYWGAGMVANGWAQSGRLEFADKVRLVSCQPSTNRPCFRLKFNVVDSQGSPLEVTLPPNKDLRGLLKVYVDDEELDPFFSVAQTSSNTQVVRGRVALILVDISGSMNIRLASGKTRFQSAQEALEQFLSGFDNSVDRVAIVPFESHNVVNRIRAAEFASTKAQAMEQISALPTPGPKNNTALYSAVDLGLQVLADQVRKTPNAASETAPETLMVVMTDGKNEVYRGDDAGLLDGPAGLQQAADAVHASGVQVIGIGFGDPGSIDEAALSQLSTKSYMATDAEKLKQIFTFARTLLTNRIVATLATPWDDRASLEGRTVRVKAALKLAGGQEFESNEGIWSAPQMGIPTFDGKCDTEELKAALPIVPISSSWLSTIRPVLVFVGLGTLLLVLWFWIPRLVWPEQYIGAFPAGGGSMRWAAMTRGFSRSKVKPSRPAPPGFQTRRGGAQPPRAPSDRTVVQPDFSRSRLQRRPPDEKDY